MAKFTVTINSILGGIAPNLFRGGPGQFAASIGIDPDLPLDLDGTPVKTGGSLTPISYQDFSSTNLTSYVNWIITCPQDENIYAYAANGRFLSYDTSFVETLVNSAGSTVGPGAAYYNNYIYLATGTNINRYGPLDNLPALTTSVWTGATLGTQTALGNATYPTQFGIAYPNHPMHVHVDNKLYVGDFETADTANQGRGKIHWIRTTQVTDEGDTNDGTTQNAFYLPFSYAPIDIESWGNDLAILAIPMHAAGASAAIIQGKTALFLWDAVNAPALPYRMIPLIDPFASALLNHNGNLYVWSGSLNDGVRISKYLGGYQLQQKAFFEEGMPPPAGCVDGMGNRIVWGAQTTYPENSMSVYAYGYKDANIPQALQNIMTTTETTAASLGTANFMVSALKYAQQASFIIPRILVAWKDGAATENFGIDRLVAETSAEIAVWRSLTYSVGRPFKIKKISISLGAAIAANMTIVPTIRIDDDSTTTTLTTINNTNYAASQRKIVLYPTISGSNNFNLQLRWTGTRIISVTLPITIEGETLQDATQ